jgi:hypothetical protein
LPEEDHSLTDKHTDGAGSQSSQNAEDCRNNDEVDNAGEGASEGTVRMAVVRARWAASFRTKAVAMAVESIWTELLGLEVLFAKWWRWREGHGIKAFFVVAVGTMVARKSHHLGVLAVAALATSLAHTHHTVFGAIQQTTNSGNEKFLEALGFAMALLPGDAIGCGCGLLDLRLGDEQLTVGILEDGDRHSVNWNRVSFQIENGKPNIE